MGSLSRLQRTFLSTDRVVLVSAGELLRALPGVRCVDVDLAPRVGSRSSVTPTSGCSSRSSSSLLMGACCLPRSKRADRARLSQRSTQPRVKVVRGGLDMASGSSFKFALA